MNLEKNISQKPFQKKYWKEFSRYEFFKFSLYIFSLDLRTGRGILFVTLCKGGVYVTFSYSCVDLYFLFLLSYSTNGNVRQAGM